MQYNDSSNHQDSVQGWQVVGELELTAGLATDQTVNKWLKVILSLLELPTDFAAKVIKSARDAVLDETSSEHVVNDKHGHLLVLALRDRELYSRNWGFFRIEKIENETDQAMPDHTIELYLYQEG